MQSFDPTSYLPLAGLVILCALVVILAADALLAKTRHREGAEHDWSQAKTAFLLDGSDIIDATPPARHILRTCPSDHPKVADLTAVLERQFPGLSAKLSQEVVDLTPIPAKTRIGGHIELERFGGCLRLTIRAAQTPYEMHPLALTAMTEELDTLRHIADTAPQLIWKRDTQGVVTWANQAYLDVVNGTPEAVTLKDTTSWPPASLFDDIDSAMLGPVPETTRQQLYQSGENQPRWYDVTSQSTRGGSMHFAVDVGVVVKAEGQSKLFVQMLTKTFSDLSAGLAVFDKSRRLITFNPALVTLTGLPAQFLAAKPTLSDVLDRLRSSGMLPEPKNYLEWRKKVIALESESADGTHHDTWALPDGVTYRVTGRPHPNGAMALLIEDISADVTSTRRFRADLDRAQAIYDSFDEAFAVFDASGKLMQNNQAYADRWSKVGNSPQDGRIEKEIGRWRTACAPFDHWDALCANMTSGREDRSGIFHLTTTDGQPVHCRITALSGGATLIGFSMDRRDRVIATTPPPHAANS